MRTAKLKTPHEYSSKVFHAQAAGNEAANKFCGAEMRSVVVESINFIPDTRVNRRRHVSRQSGEALETLGHAIEYLADEFAFHGGVFATGSPDDPQIRAIQILMAANRSVYFECPIAPSFRERLRALW